MQIISLLQKYNRYRKNLNILYVDSDYFKFLLKRSENIELNILENNISQNNNDISGFINY